jgi:transposase
MLIVTKRDARRLNACDQEKLRHRAIKLWNNGTRPSEISDLLGVSLASIYNWHARHREGSDEALKSMPRRGASQKISEKQMQAVAKKIIMTLPNQFGYDGGLWTKALIDEDLSKQQNLKISRWTLARMCRKLGLQMEQRDPLERAQQHREAADWANKLIAQGKRKMDDNVRLYVAHVFPIKETSIIGKVWKTVPLLGSASSSCCIMSAVAPRGDVHFMVAPQVLNEIHFQSFIDQLMIGQKSRVILIVNKDFALSSWVAQESMRKFTNGLQLIEASGFKAAAREV